MQIKKDIFILFIVVVFSKLKFCFSNLQSMFRLELEDAAVDNNNQPALNESTSNEIECYMKCLDNQGICCLLQMKEELDKVSCLLYGMKFSDASFRSDVKSKISSVVDCKQPKDCKELYQKGHTKDGVYEISIDGTAAEVFCDMTTDGGGWTIFQRRIDGSVNFERTWDKYKNGFGKAGGEYWLGNDLIHGLTKDRNDTLIRIEGMDSEGVRKHITMKGFWIEAESSKYRLHAGTSVTGEQGMIDDWLFGDGKYFTTIDRDNDEFGGGNCAERGAGGGWWYKGCYSLILNGEYSSTYTPIYWKSWQGFDKSSKSIKMQLK